jgi:hypothetical protein
MTSPIKKVPPPNQKAAPSFKPGPLTPQEIELLQQDLRQASAQMRVFFRKHFARAGNQPDDGK